MQTQFAAWLAERGQKPYQFGDTHGIGRKLAYQLAGVGVRQTNESVNVQLLEMVSLITSIPPGVLVEEMMQAMKNPTPPRAYRRKEDEDGTTQKERA